MTEPTNPTIDTQKVPLKEQIAYGTGRLPGAFYGSFMGQIQAFYYAWMGLHVGYILLAQIIFAIWNVINDPIFGFLQNRTRTSSGRYLPWIKVFSPIFTVGFIIVFMVPSEWRFAVGGVNTEFWVFLWYCFSQCFYDLGFTIVYLAHAALLAQISHKFEERTRMSVLATIFAVLGEVLSGAFPLMFLTDPTSEKILAFQICVIIFGIISLIPWFLIVKYVKERCELIPSESESFWRNIKYVFKNPACRVYMVYDGITVGIFNTFFMAITFIMTWTFGVENPFMVHPLTFLDIMPYLIFPIVCAILGIILQFWIPKKWDLKTLLLVDYIFMFVGFLIAFFGALPSLSQSDVVFESPPNLWLVSIGFGVLILGFFGNIIYLDPLNADVVDYDEILTGNRRESVYSGTNCILSKTMQSVVLVIFPAILSLYGLVPASPDDPTSSALVVRIGFHNAIRGVAVASFLFPAMLALVGFISFLWYPLNRKKLQEIRGILDEKHVKQKEAFDINLKKI